jgi:hypothetical protein
MSVYKLQDCPFLEREKSKAHNGIKKDRKAKGEGERKC